ncbi:ATP-binding cassette domain-containing protein [Listeria booriae]|uniref:ATP-binding cassette domain-containing protein n=1 Tax=Listeria booriae TaxID=1552123 RepID=UPI001627E6AD|nr:ATP-binding cassette domain-containing protein [Listeria booriae]MBC1211950.1 ATP-binding cassette domain-containing protein [Listeria booriae]MBC1227227.1 ATP-binding cassette domain-containing protein [Listeria booriae]MBC1230694.1 ATP-binding cassette domain-containing protein [Listeria booriae]
MLEIINLEKHYKNKKILAGFNLKLDSKGIIFFLGKNGAGKTTFFNCIMGFEDYLGEITKPVNIAVVFDESQLYSNLNAYDNIKLLVGRGLEQEERVLLLKYIDDSVLKRKIGSYSLGQKKIISIFIALFTKPEMLILDEVSNGLDYETAKQVKNLLISCKEKMLILVCGHQFDFYNQILDEVFVINDMQLIHVDVNKFTDLESVYEQYVG